MTNALRPALPKAADGASVGVITPRKFSRRKILGATGWSVRRIHPVMTQRNIRRNGGNGRRCAILGRG